MRKSFAWILAAVMVLSCAACSGSAQPAQTQAPAATAAATTAAQPAQTQAAAATTAAQPAQTQAAAPAETAAAESKSRANADGSYRFLYGWDNNEIRLVTPEGVKSEGTGVYDPNYVEKDGVFQGMSVSFEAEDGSWYCQARDWQSNTANYIDHPAMYYFNGELDEEGKKEYPSYDQTVTDLGFKWENRPVQLIVSEFQTASGLDYTNSFVGVEYDNKSAPDGGKGLLGLDFTETDLTRDQLAYVAGKIFGVDSGIQGDPFAEAASGPAEASIDASAIVGSWLDPESTWGTCFTFNSDGSGARSATVTGERKEFSYQLEGSKIKLKYSDGLEDELTAEPLGDALNLTDSYGTTTKYEAAEEPEAPAEGITPEALEGVWLDTDGDGYTFNTDGTGKYEEGDEEWDLTYTILNGDSISVTYSDGDHKTFYVEINGDELSLDRTWVMTRQ